MSFSTSVWNGSDADWTASADWSQGEPGPGTTDLAALFGGAGGYTVTVTTDIGAIATSGSTASTVGLSVTAADTFVKVDPGGTLLVGATDGDGGLVTMASGAIEVAGGSFSATNTLTLGGASSFIILNDGVAGAAALDIAGAEAEAFIESGGTLAISGALTQTGGIFWFFGVGDLLELGDVSGTATVDLNHQVANNPDSRVYWTNSVTSADLANLTLQNFGTSSTLDVATATAVAITGTQLAGNALTIDTSGGNLVVGLGTGAASQYFARPATLGAQTIVRVTAGLTTSNWIDGTTGNWTTAADWDDGVPPGGSASNYAAVLSGTDSYTAIVSSNVGTIAVAGAGASSVGLTVNDAAAYLEIDSGSTLVVGAANGDGGLVTIAAGQLLVGGSFSATNTVTLGGVTSYLDLNPGGVASVAALSVGAGEVDISGVTTLTVSGALTESAGHVYFFGPGSALLALGDISGAVTVDLNYYVDTYTDSRVYWTNSATTADLANLTLKNFGTSSTLDVATASAATITGTILAGNALTIDTSGGDLVVGLGTGAAAQYFATTTAIGGQNVVEITACFLRGTRIATPGGTIAVEDLREGDAVLTRSGVSSVQWIGWRDIDCRRHPKPRDVWPVRIDPDAFGPGQPRRTLRLSPDHAVFIDGVLIPVRNLVNGATIVQETAKSVSYRHVELPRHDILFAEGLACESYLDTGNRGAFANSGGAVMLHPDFALRVWEAEACAALVRDGAELEAARSVLLERASQFGHRLTRDPALRLIAGRREIAADCVRQGRTLSATLPRGARRVRLLSRRFAPAHARPESDDWRSLGVAVTRVWLDDEEIARDDPRLEDGWHAPEATWRWTDGAATLAIGTARRVRVEWADAGLYWGERDVLAPLRARGAAM